MPIDPLTIYASAALIGGFSSFVGGYSQAEAQEKATRRQLDFQREENGLDRALREKELGFQRDQWADLAPTRKMGLVQQQQGSEGYENKLRRDLYRLKGHAK